MRSINMLEEVFITYQIPRWLPSSGMTLQDKEINQKDGVILFLKNICLTISG